MINIIEDLYNPTKHIQLMLDSVNYINNRLNSFYNTEQEREDIQRNLDYLKIMIAKPFIAQNIQAEQSELVNSAIDRAESVLSMS